MMAPPMAERTSRFWVHETRFSALWEGAPRTGLPHPCCARSALSKMTTVPTDPAGVLAAADRGRRPHRLACKGANSMSAVGVHLTIAEYARRVRKAKPLSALVSYCPGV